MRKILFLTVLLILASPWLQALLMGIFMWWVLYYLLEEKYVRNL